MPITRSPRPETNFLVISKDITESPHLSWAARGVLAYLLGKPDHWVVRMADLIAQTQSAVGKTTNRDGMRVIVQELLEARYMTVAQARASGGVFGSVEYVVHDSPQSENPATAPQPEIPRAAEPLAENPPLVRTDLLARNEKEATTEAREVAIPKCFLPDDDEPEQETAPAHPKRVKTEKVSKAGFMPPEWVPADAWAGWLEMRRRKNVPNTDRALRTAIKELDKLCADGWDAEKVVDLATMNGWRAFYEPRDRSMRSDAKPPPIATGSRKLDALAEQMERMAAARSSRQIAGGTVTGPEHLLAKIGGKS